MVVIVTVGYPVMINLLVPSVEMYFVRWVAFITADSTFIKEFASVQGIWVFDAEHHLQLS
jgi:hypothetical protein